ncbi:uncharacterized protein METZ01_LOCUS263682 [marine metagenome]|uniref:Uncharacterized protein n=1 Tax=marine metagenome TaxID=408172 RepID=A0A382JGI4_9ZZZZ
MDWGELFRSECRIKFTDLRQIEQDFNFLFLTEIEGHALVWIFQHDVGEIPAASCARPFPHSSFRLLNLHS